MDGEALRGTTAGNRTALVSDSPAAVTICGDFVASASRGPSPNNSQSQARKLNGHGLQPLGFGKPLNLETSRPEFTCKDSRDIIGAIATRERNGLLADDVPISGDKVLVVVVKTGPFGGQPGCSPRRSRVYLARKNDKLRRSYLPSANDRCDIAVSAEAARLQSAHESRWVQSGVPTPALSDSAERWVTYDEDVEVPNTPGHFADAGPAWYQRPGPIHGSRLDADGRLSPRSWHRFLRYGIVQPQYRPGQPD